MLQNLPMVVDFAHKYVGDKNAFGFAKGLVKFANKVISESNKAISNAGKGGTRGVPLPEEAAVPQVDTNTGMGYNGNSEEYHSEINEVDNVSSGINNSNSGKVLVRGKYTESQIKMILEEIQKDGFKNNPLRQAYENEVTDLTRIKDGLFKQGLSNEDVAKTLNQARRNLGIKYKEATPQPLRDYIYEINQNRYGDPLGPTVDTLLERGKTYEQIIESSSKPNADINKLLSGFEEWLRRQ